MSINFNPKEYDSNDLWKLVIQEIQLKNEDVGIDEDCLLCTLAGCNEYQYTGLILMKMEKIAYSSAVELLRRQCPDKFEN